MKLTKGSKHERCWELPDGAQSFELLFTNCYGMIQCDVSNYWLIERYK